MSIGKCAIQRINIFVYFPAYECEKVSNLIVQIEQSLPKTY